MKFEFEKAYYFLNDTLFDGELPPVIITTQRKKNSRGFFRPESFKAKDGDDKADELALNPDSFDRDDKLVLSTLAHEMAHVWQQVYGKPSRNGYHNRQWADKMEKIGLMASDTGTEGGKKTGPKMAHYVLPGDAFDLAADKLIGDGFKIDWAGLDQGTKTDQKKKNKIKYTCQGCGQNAWAKPKAGLMCALCYVETGEVEVMEADE